MALRLGWPSAWCAAEITVATLRLGLSDGGGTLEVNGFGESFCYGTPGSGERAPISVGAFAPQEFTPSQVVTTFASVTVEAIAPATATPGERLHFVVVLTAPAGRDVPLDPCPDYRITLATVTGSTEKSYALNCAAVSYRDAAGHPQLPAGTPVRFDMEVEVPPAATSAAKLVWQLVISDLVAAAAEVEIH